LHCLNFNRAVVTLALMQRRLWAGATRLNNPSANDTIIALNGLKQFRLWASEQWSHHHVSAANGMEHTTGPNGFTFK